MREQVIATRNFFLMVFFSLSIPRGARAPKKYPALTMVKRRAFKDTSQTKNPINIGIDLKNLYNKNFLVHNSSYKNVDFGS